MILIGFFLKARFLLLYL